MADKGKHNYINFFKHMPLTLGFLSPSEEMRFKHEYLFKSNKASDGKSFQAFVFFVAVF